MSELGQVISGGLGGSGDDRPSPKNLFLAEVVAVSCYSKLSVVTDNKDNRDSMARFNADEHAIKCRMLGTNYDGAIKLNEDEIIKLPNCFPLMPKHINLVPKVGEFVFIILTSESERFNDRFYIGPVISSSVKLDFDQTKTALSNFIDGSTTPTEEIGKIPLARGVYESSQHVVIEGRNNTDIIQRPGEILLRAGKFVENNPKVFNSKNPGYIQIKHNASWVEDMFNFGNYPPSSTSDEYGLNELGEELANLENKIVKNGTVTNIVSDKINLLTYKGSPLLDENLTTVDEDGIAKYIDEKDLTVIMEESHELVFGDILLRYLKIMRKAITEHCHNNLGAGKSTIGGGGENYINELKTTGKQLENQMLSNNIRIN